MNLPEVYNIDPLFSGLVGAGFKGYTSGLALEDE
jgi:hypothetical protein